jgi:hypothetical protein
MRRRRAIRDALLRLSLLVQAVQGFCPPPLLASDRRFGRALLHGASTPRFGSASPFAAGTRLSAANKGPAAGGVPRGGGSDPSPESARRTGREPQQQKEARGDPLRASTGIRPSLHPVTINAVASVLRERAAGAGPESSGGSGAERQHQRSALADPSSDPVDRALAAGRVAADAIGSRRSTSANDGMRFTPGEEQTVAGRIVGVTMRLAGLEATLRRRCSGAPWVARYGAWDSFGVLSSEAVAASGDGVDGNDGGETDGASEQLLRERIRDDPLFRLSRAECLLALFLHDVERPELAAKNATVPDGSAVDFLDEDRREVLLR